MRSFISGTTRQLKEAIEVSKNSNFIKKDILLSNVVICGLGGSGIAGTIISKLLIDQINVPVVINNNYTLPAFINKNTLVIVSTYSGNTEETLSAMEIAMQKGAEIACITSGGKAKQIAEENGYNLFLLPTGMPPRACFPFSLIAQHHMFEKYGFIDGSWKNKVEDAIQLIHSQNDEIISYASKIAKQIGDKTPVVYTSDYYEGIGKRFCQQISENSKLLCWTNKFPEMNHNEIVGWSKPYSNLVALFLEFDDDLLQVKKRMEYSREIIQKYASEVLIIKSKGKSPLEKVIYMVYLNDWITLESAEQRGIDPIEIGAILSIKEKISKLS